MVAVHRFGYHSFRSFISQALHSFLSVCCSRDSHAKDGTTSFTKNAKSYGQFCLEDFSMVQILRSCCLVAVVFFNVGNYLDSKIFCPCGPKLKTKMLYAYFFA